MSWQILFAAASSQISGPLAAIASPCNQRLQGLQCLMHIVLFPSALAAFSPPNHHIPFLHPSRNRTPLSGASNVLYMPHLAWHHLFRCIAQVIAVKRCTPLSSHSFPYLEFCPCYIPTPFNVRKLRYWPMWMDCRPLGYDVLLSSSRYIARRLGIGMLWC